MLVENLGDAEGAGRVGNQQRAGVGASVRSVETSMRVLVVFTLRTILFFFRFWRKHLES